MTQRVFSNRLHQLMILMIVFTFNLTSYSGSNPIAPEDPDIVDTGPYGWSWQNPLPQGNRLLGVCFADTSNGIVVGYTGTILRTTDGGSSWTSQTSGTSTNLYSVSFTDTNNGTAVETATKYATVATPVIEIVKIILKMYGVS